MFKTYRTYSILLSLLVLLQSCFRLHNSQGGGQIDYKPDQRHINPADVLLPEGYNIEVVARGLTFPTSVVEDDEGRLYVIESGYSYGEVFSPPKLFRIDEEGNSVLIAEGTKNGPWTGLDYHQDNFYVAEGGQLEGGKILRIDREGEIISLVENLPSLGDHHTNGLVVKDGYVYFGQDTATNSGIIGPDNAEFGWLTRNPDFHDIPCKDVILKDMNYTNKNPLTNNPDAKVTTGGYVAFGRTGCKRSDPL